MTEGTPWNRRSTPLPEPHLARLQRRMAKGQSLEQAAEEVGLTLSLAKSVYIRSGLPIPKPLLKRSVDPEVAALGKRIHEHLRRVDSATAADVAAALGVTARQVRTALWAVDEPRLLPPLSMSERFPDSAILIGLQIMSIERGRLTYARRPVPVSAGYWDEHRNPEVHPRAAEVIARFGTWVKACERAGLPTRQYDTGAGAQRRWTDDELMACVRDFLASGGASPTAYLDWAVGRDNVPSLGTITTRLGRWTQVRAAALR